MTPKEDWLFTKGPTEPGDPRRLPRKRGARKPKVSLVVDLPHVLPRTNLTPAEMAADLDISKQTLANWRCIGYGPPFMKYGPGKHKVMYPIGEYKEWKKRHTFKSVAAYRAFGEKKPCGE